MADVNDTTNINGKRERERERLQKAHADGLITDDELSAIRAFLSHRRVQDGCEQTTILTDSRILRCIACWIKQDDEASPFVPADSVLDFSLADANGFLEYLVEDESTGGRGLDDEASGFFGYKRGMKVFFRYLNSSEHHGDYPWFSEIELGQIGTDRVRENLKDKELLSQDEIELLKQNARNARDRALIAFLADTAGRVSLVTQLRVGDIHDLDTEEPYFTPNPDGVAQKGVSGTKKLPIMSSRAELRSYLNRAHFDPRDIAPLWHLRHGYDEDSPEDCAVSTSHVRNRLKDIAERAGIDKARVHPHMFRHATVTRLAKDDRVDREFIVHIADWYDESMLEVYDHRTDSDKNSTIHSALGFSDADDSDDGGPSRPVECGNCREKVAPSSQFCPNCGSPVGQAARQVREAGTEVVDRIAELAMKDDLSPSERTQLETLREVYSDSERLVDAYLRSDLG
jgi:integrase